MCKVISCVVGGEYLSLDIAVCSLDKTLLLFALLHFFTPRPNLPVIPGSSWLPTFTFQSPLMKKTSFLVLVLQGVVGLYRNSQLQFLWHYVLGINLDYCDIEQFAMEMNWDSSVILEIAPKYCISGGISGSSDSKESTCNAGDSGLIPGSERSPGERNGYPL